MKQYKYKVATQCITYNHRPYIEDALNGFVIQQTDFPVVFVVVDDASTDGEPDYLRIWAENNLNFSEEIACRKQMPYGELIFGVYKNSHDLFFAILLLSENHHQTGKDALKLNYISEWCDNAEYIAICEGDDYWIDSKKLSKQVGFMESHDDYSLCFHSAIEHWENRKKNDRVFSIIRDKDYIGPEILKKWIVPTASIVCRRDILFSELYCNVIRAKLIVGDTPLICTAAAFGKLRGMKKIMSVYRRHSGGATAIPRSLDVTKRFINYMRIFTSLFGKEYSKIAHHHIGEYIVDGFMKAYRQRDLKEAKLFISLRKKEDTPYVYWAFISYPFRMFYNKYISSIFRKLISIRMSI